MTEKSEDIFELIQKGESEAVKKLITSKKVDVNCLDKTGLSLIDQAAFKGNEELVEWLLAHNANPHSKANNDSYTSLMFAALSGNARICQMLLEAGVNSEALNKLGKTASEMAAFTGQHECVSVINSYVSYSVVDKILHPNGANSTEIYPQELVEFIHELVKGNQIHPIRIIFKIVENEIVKKYKKKVLWTIDRLFERQLRFKSSNEMMSIKLWLIYFPLNEVLKYVDRCHKEERYSKLGSDELLLLFAKQITEMKEGSVVKEFEEMLLRNTVRAFPYTHSLLYITLLRAICSSKLGERPTAYNIIMQSLYGTQLTMTTKFCSTCGIPGAKLRCQKCRTIYCSQKCQKFDWTYHKKCCKYLEKYQFVSEIETLSIEDIEKMKSMEGTET
uniref:MYND-type domain-containing protein n=1 Tax=Parastrongyloides trichosuri TaxID=131310 RepID=A0A0N4ZF64_PARTI